MSYLETDQPKARRIGRAKRRRALRQLLAADVDVVELEQTLGVRLEQLAGWSLDEHTQSEVEGLLRWLDMQAQMMVGRYRMAAAAKLYELAMQTENVETSRRACVDLLKTNMMQQRDDQVAAMRGPRDLTFSKMVDVTVEPEMYAALEGMGRAAEDAEEEEDEEWAGLTG